MNKNDTKLLLKIAEDVSSTDQDLLRAWKETTSVKVRKAVASNPNAPASVLKEASRLYIEEVLRNPGFEMLTLFDTDEWVQNIHAAYTNPHEYLRIKGYYYAFGGGTQKDIITKVLLLSSRLDGVILESCINSGSLTAMDRVNKDPLVKSKIVNLAQSGSLKSSSHGGLSATSLLIMFSRGVINFEMLNNGLKNYTENSVSIKKSTYMKFFKEAGEEAVKTQDLNERNKAVEAIARTLYVSRSQAVSWFCNCFWETNPLNKELVSNVLAECTRLAGTMAKKTRSNKYQNLVIKIAEELMADYFRTERRTEDIASMYLFLKSKGLIESVSLIERLFPFSVVDAVGLEHCDLEIRDFFIRKRSFGSSVVAREGDRVYNLLNKTNNEIYEKEGVGPELLFRSCELKGTVNLGQ